MTATFDPDVFREEKGNRREPVTGKEEVLDIHHIEDRVAREIDFQGEGAVAVVGEQLVAGLEVAAGPGGAPPAGGHADLRIGSLDLQVEGLGLEPVPDVCREGADFLSGGITLSGEAVVAAPGHGTLRSVVLPERNQLGLPVSAVGSRFVTQLRQGELPAVVGVQLADEFAVEDVLLRNRDDDGAFPLAVEAGVFDDERIAVRVQEFDLVDEFQVFAVDGQLLAAPDLLAFLLGETGNDSPAEDERQPGLGFLVRGPDEDLAACRGEARRSGNPDHLIADNLEIGHADAVGENDFLDAREAGTVDGHRLSGHHLRGEEHLDAQAEVG